MNRRHGRRLADPRRLAHGLLLALALILAALPAAAASAKAALQGDEHSYTDPVFGWSITWDPAIWVMGGELPTAPNDAGVSGVDLSINGTDMTYGGLFVGSHPAYGDDLATCLAEAPSAFEAYGVNFEDVQEADDLDPPATVDDAETTLAYATISGGGQVFNGVIYVECRPLVEGEAVMRIVWVLFDPSHYETARPAFEDLLAGIDMGGAQSASEGSAGETYTDPFTGWSVTYNPIAWELGAQPEYDENGELIMTSYGAGFAGTTYDTHGNVSIIADTVFGDDADACLESIRERETGRFPDVQETDFEPPTAPDDAVWEMYILQTGFPSVIYFACLPLVEGESVLRISWSLGNPENYEDALPVFNALLAGLDLSEVHTADTAVIEAVAAEAAAGESYTDPTYGWTISWDSNWIKYTAVNANDPSDEDVSIDGWQIGAGTVFLSNETGDVAACLAAWRPEPNGQLPHALTPPTAPEEGAAELYLYTLGHGLGEGTIYVECRPLAGGEATLAIVWVVEDAADYEAALPHFNALIAGLEVPGGEASAEPSETDDEASEEPVDEEPADDEPAGAGALEAELAEVDGSGVSGTAVVSDEPDGLAVTIELEGAFAAGQKPYVHSGTCDAYDPEPAFSLRPVDEAGLSESRQIAVDFADLTAEPHVIVLTVSRADPTVVACGELAG
jgi:hypothetical protein